jgi:hypothetical protein
MSAVQQTARPPEASVVAGLEDDRRDRGRAVAVLLGRRRRLRRPLEDHLLEAAPIGNSPRHSPQNQNRQQTNPLLDDKRQAIEYGPDKRAGRSGGVDALAAAVEDEGVAIAREPLACVGAEEG